MIAVELDARAPLSLVRTFSKNAQKKLGDAVEKVGRKLERDSKQYAPFVHGNLRRSIDFKREGATGMVRAKANYSAFVHGSPYHHSSKPRKTTPFFTMAKDHNLKFAEDELAKAVDQAVKISTK